MALSHSSALKNYCLDSGFGTAFDTDGRINIYSGTRPASADAVISGPVLLGTLILSADAFAAAASGALVANAVTPDSSADATATATWFRMFKNADNPATASTTLRRLDGTVTATGGGGDLTLDNVAITLGGTISLTGMTYTHPA